MHEGETKLISTIKQTPRKWLVIGIVAVILMSWLEVLDRQSDNYIDRSLINASLSFATARTINAVISVVESTTVSFSMFGIGGNIAPGELLGPINDMAEEFASWMQTSIASLALQKVLLSVVSDTLFKVALTLVGLSLIASIYLKSETELLYKSFLFMAMLRFLLVVVVLLNGVTGRLFLEDRIQEEARTLEALPMAVEQLQDASPLTDQERDSLNLQLEQLRLDRSTTLSQSEQFIQQIEVARAALEAAQIELTNVESSMPVYERLNPYNSNEAHILARESRRDKQEALSGILAQQELVQEAMTSIEAQIQTAENILAGRPNSIFDSVGQSFSNVAGQAQSLAAIDFESLNNRFEDAIMSMINAMILFMLQTVILPLFFIYMLSKLMKSVWGIDLKGFVTRSKEELKSESLPSS